jgi:AcrR family transcriptional regulator
VVEVKREAKRDGMSRREEYAETTRTAILDAAVARFTSDGFARTTVDAVAETARVTKGAVYHHFKGKAELFEAAFIRLEERLLAAVAAADQGVDDPWEAFSAGVDAYLEACGQPDFRRIVLEEAPVALGWARWKEIEERYFLGLVAAALDVMAQAGLIRIPDGDLTARMVLAAISEAGLAVAAADHPQEERARVGALVMRLLDGLR